MSQSKNSKECSLVNARLAIHNTDPDTVADLLNGMLKPLVDEGKLVGYQLLNTHEPLIFQATKDNARDDLFDDAKCYAICVLDTEHNEEWVTVETTLNLSAMDEDELRDALTSKVIIGEDDRIFVGALKGMARLTL